MVLSCLVEPLVPPLVKRRPGSVGTIPRGRRLAATALAATALALVSTTVEDRAPELERIERVRVTRNAHRRPDPPPRPLPALDTVLDEVRTRAALRVTPRFEWDALRAHRLRHRQDLAQDQRPGLGLGRHLDRLISPRDANFLRFGSATPRTGLPVSG